MHWIFSTVHLHSALQLYTCIVQYTATVRMHTSTEHGNCDCTHAYNLHCNCTHAYCIVQNIATVCIVQCSVTVHLHMYGILEMPWYCCSRVVVSSAAWLRYLSALLSKLLYCIIIIDQSMKYTLRLHALVLFT